MKLRTKCPIGVPLFLELFPTNVYMVYTKLYKLCYQKKKIKNLLVCQKITKIYPINQEISVVIISSHGKQLGQKTLLRAQWNSEVEICNIRQWKLHRMVRCASPPSVSAKSLIFLTANRGLLPPPLNLHSFSSKTMIHRSPPPPKNLGQKAKSNH